jgi:hypothetical protein
MYRTGQQRIWLYEKKVEFVDEKVEPVETAES